MADPVVSVPLSQRADQNAARYEYLRFRGHMDYCEQVLRNERMYNGAVKGQYGQWEPDDETAMVNMGRMPVEINELAQAIDTAIGYQIANRMDIAFRPRGHGADDETADTLGKVAMQVADANRLHWTETEVFSNGLIDQRGYFDIRMSYDDNIGGEIEIISDDPCDVVPDPDASSWHPDKWADVTSLRWYTRDEIAQFHGKDKADKVAEQGPIESSSYADWAEERKRARFGTSTDTGDWWDWFKSDLDTRRYRVIDRQYFVYENCKVVVYVNTGDVRVVDGMEDEELQGILEQPGVVPSKRMMRRVKWLITCGNTVLFDDYSPWPFFTKVPYFPYFRKGKTRSMVDRGTWPQRLLNKSISTGMAMFNHLAKGVWQGEANNLYEMTPEQFKRESSKPGFSIFLKDAAKPFTFTAPAQMPAAISEFVTLARQTIKSTTGVTEELSAQNSDDLSGVAIQARQYAAQQKLAIPLDNLAKTRNLLAERILWFIQHYYTGPRIFRITEKDNLGQDQTKEVAINQPTPEGNTLNDLTIGTYDVVVSEQPIAITFDNTQFQQLKDIKDLGEPIPIEWLVRYSNIADKSELIEAVQKQNAAPPPSPDPKTQSEIDVNAAKGDLLKAQKEKAQNDAAQSAVVTIYTATQAAGEVASLPQVAGIADDILGSAGFVDRDSAPVITPPAGIGDVAQGAGLAQDAPPVPTVAPGQQPSNTDPLTPAGPPTGRVGADAGIRKPGVQ